MNSIYQTYRFYKNPLFTLSIINIVLFYFYGSYFEEYEGIFSSFVQGIYTTPSTKEWNADVHFLLFSLYAYINQFFPNTPIYGIFLVIYNWLSLTFIGLVLYRILKINLKNYNQIFFICTYLILSVDNITNLSTNRIVFILLAATFSYVESCMNEKKQIDLVKTILIITIMFFATLLRFDFAILAAMIYIILSLLHKSINRFVVFSFLIAVFVTISYNILMTYTMSEPRQIYYYKELDFIMRNNYNYAQLSLINKMEVDAFYHAIFDRIHFQWDFYNSIAIRGNTKGIISLFFGLHYDAFLNTLSKSIKEYKMAWYFIAFCMFNGSLIIINKKSDRYYWSKHLIIMILFPLLVCFYVVTPLRFLVPYYSIVGIFYTLVLLYYNNSYHYIKQTIFIMLIFVLYNAYIVKIKYDKKEEFVELNTKKLDDLYLKFNENKNLPIVINNFNQEKFFPVNCLKKMKKQSVLFQNLYYFMSYDCYIDKWKEVCNCNPLSLSDKIDYVVKNQNLFIIDEERFNYLSEYYSIKYHLKLQKTFIQKFDDELNVYKLSYVN